VILEGIVTTLDSTGALNIAPMGPQLEAGTTRFILRPFRTSTTYRNLSSHGEGVLHVTDDVVLFARSVLGADLDEATRPAEFICGKVLTSACRYDEFRVTRVDDRNERVTFFAESVHSGRLRDFFGFNRAKHAVIETAILASRADFLQPEQLLEELPKFRTIVIKTGGDDEIGAFELLEEHIRTVLARRGVAGAETHS
jgi:hypothetical protein